MRRTESKKSRMKLSSLQGSICVSKQQNVTDSPLPYFIHPSVQPGKCFEWLTTDLQFLSDLIPSLSHLKILYSKGARSSALLMPLCQLLLLLLWKLNQNSPLLWLCRVIIGWAVCLRVWVCGGFSPKFCVCKRERVSLVYWHARPIILQQGDQIHSSSNSQWSTAPFVMTSSAKCFFPPQNSICCLFRKHKVVLCHDYSHKL